MASLTSSAKMAAGLALAVMSGVSLVYAGAEVVLSDGRVLQGVDIRRDGDLYLLQQESGTIVPLPLELVTEVRLMEAAPPPPPPADFVDPATGLTYRSAPQTLASGGVPQQGVDTSGPRQLAGAPVEPPRTNEQLAVLGKPSQFSRGVIDPNWTPGSGWVKPDPDGWAPSKWSEGPIDPNWHPSSSFPSESSLEGSRSTWQSAPIDSSWQPKSGF